MGTDAAELALYNVVGGRLLPDGETVIADAGNHRFLVFARSGLLVDSLGGRGEGPGEFENITWLQMIGDDLVAYDARTRRVTRLDQNGGLVGTTPFRPDVPEPPSDDAVRTSGAALAVTTGGLPIGYAAAFADPQGREGPMELFAAISTFDSASTQLESGWRLTLMDWYEDPTQGVPVANRLGAGRIYWHADGPWLAIVSPFQHQVDLLRDGALTTIVREERERVPFEPDSVPALYHSAVDSLQGYSSVRVSSAAEVWVRPSTAGSDSIAEWRVFRTDGTGVAVIALPSDAEVLDAADGRVLLLRRDEYDAESIEIRRIEDPT